MSFKKIENPEKFRSNVKEKIDQILKNEKNSSNLEKGIFNYSLNEAKNKRVVKKWDNPHFVQIYLDRLKSIYVNLNNAELLEQINNGSIKPHTVAFMTHQEMRPDRWKELIDAKTKRDMHKYENNIEAATDTFTCRKCKSNKCTYYLQQIRSADEPCTIFVTCLFCGQRWKTS
jgi:transcription elongation factor S-II